MDGLPHNRAPVEPDTFGLAGRLSQLRRHLDQSQVEMFKLTFGQVGKSWTKWEGGTVPPLRVVALIGTRWDVDLNWLILGKGKMFNV